jgi:predicted DsbA family dithiol-disulfide isomerase
MAKPLTVEVWSDVACPWCWVGKRRLGLALERFAHAADVQVIWRAFELDPAAPPVREGDYVERLARKYGRSRAEAQAMVERMVETGAREGLRFDFSRIQGGNTFVAHRLLRLAREQGLQDRVKERFFRGYFSEGAAIGEPEAVLALALDAGLDAEAASALIHTDQFADAVRADQREAREIGVDGVPFFLFGRRYALAGAQPPELLLRALEQTWQEREAQAGEQTQGPVCGPDGCD